MSFPWKSFSLATGAALCFVAGTYWSSSAEPTPAPSESAAPVQAVQDARPSDTSPTREDTRLRELERQMAELNAQRAAQEAARQDMPHVPRMPTPEEMEQRYQQGLEEFAMKLDAHTQERVDVEWARPAARALESDMGSVMESIPQEERGKLLGLDCRTSTCVATVEFPTFVAAKDQFPRLVEHSYGVPCGRTVVLDKPADPLAPFKMRLLFEGCARN
jgi:soluble cytochrome b562